MRSIYFYDTSVGRIGIADDGKAVTELIFAGNEMPGESGAGLNETALIREAAEQLLEYLEGKRKAFDLPLAPEGTSFQKAVWKALTDVPYGETRTYKDIAENIGNPKACRAVGMANNKNPIAIMIPCHRVIGAGGKLVGYAGGLDIKQKLLELEKVGIKRV